MDNNISNMERTHLCKMYIGLQRVARNKSQQKKNVGGFIISKYFISKFSDFNKRWQQIFSTGTVQNNTEQIGRLRLTARWLT